MSTKPPFSMHLLFPKSASYIRAVILFIALNFNCLQSQSKTIPHIPIAAYQLRYWFDPQDYPLGGIRLQGKKTDFNKYLHKNYEIPLLKEQREEVTYLPQWGYDSIRCLEKTFAISPFYIQRTEVTNQQYKSFLADSASLFFKNGKITPAWIYPDTNVWLSSNIFHEPFISYYFQHPAYNEYPVVGVSQFQATQYCNWLEEKLNERYKKYLPQGYKILVDLPTHAEFVKTTQFIAEKSPTTSTRASQDKVKSYVINHINQINSGPIKTLRLADIFERNTQLFLTQNAICKGEPICHVFGNVSEWTSTQAKGKLYNQLEYVYTMSQRIVPNSDVTPEMAALEGYLYKSEDLQLHYAVKGGSFVDEFHYLDPSAVKFYRGDFKSSDLGFRTVIRIIKENP
jgi:formylglycine-generating enzyme required for sulfatase activity